MIVKRNQKLNNVAKMLRKNATKEERRLWYTFLSKHDGRFYRQKVFGKYIVDFYSARANLVIEIDGSQHYIPSENNDLERTEYLKQYGVEIIRISNLEINRNFKSVCEYIDMIVKQRVKK